MSLVNSIEKMFQDKKERNWDRLYIAIDLHDTIAKSGRDISLHVYPEAARGLIYLSTISYITLILYTSTHIDKLKEFYNWCDVNGIIFKYLNDNPECSTDLHHGDYSKKPYFNLLLDDKTKFDYQTDWAELIFTIDRVKDI